MSVHQKNTVVQVLYRWITSVFPTVLAPAAMAIQLLVCPGAAPAAAVVNERADLAGHENKAFAVSPGGSGDRAIPGADALDAKNAASGNDSPHSDSIARSISDTEGISVLTLSSSDGSGAQYVSLKGPTGGAALRSAASRTAAFRGGTSGRRAKFAAGNALLLAALAGGMAYLAGKGAL